MHTSVTFVVAGSLTGRLGVPAGGPQWATIPRIAVVGTAPPLVLDVTRLSYTAASHAAIISPAEPVVTKLLGIAVGGLLGLTGVLLIQTEIAAGTRTAY